MAKNDVVVFVHQDVFLHSMATVIEAAGQMQLGRFGILGAVGVGADGRITGRIRDRVVLLGEPVMTPTDVQSLDEVLFMVPRSLVRDDPLTESPDMAWHAYAVEYGLRIRRRGLRVGVADIPLTHNSLTVNLDRLDTAHEAVAARYADMLPVPTTCGVVTGKKAKTPTAGWLWSHRWRYRWLRESLAVQGARRGARENAAVLADIRRDVDGVIDRSPGQRLYVVNRSSGLRFADGGRTPLELVRRDGIIVVATHEISEIPVVVETRPPGSWLLLTNLSQEDLRLINSRLPASHGVIGYHGGIGFWMLIGPSIADLPPQWRSARATPLGMRAAIPEVVS